MEKGICNIAFIPLRKEPADSSEMVSQLLFGEIYDIIEKKGSWVQVSNNFDGYLGWISEKVIVEISSEQFLNIQSKPYKVVHEAFCIATDTAKQQKIVLPAGCILFNYHQEQLTFLNTTYKLNLSELPEQYSSETKVLTTAYNLINTPYLWGGRNSFGIDCSGLVQTCFHVAGIKLPRDAYQQDEMGIKISTVEDGKPADVAFFINEKGRVVHTGILLNNNEIIHASGKVRIDKIDKNGIYNAERSSYTHKLASIRRYI